MTTTFKQDEIIEMARQAGIEEWWDSGNEQREVLQEYLEAFAKLVADKERQACAEIAEKQRYAMDISLTSHPAQNGTAVGILNQIRARGKA